MMILDELADYARIRVAKDCEENSIEVLQELCCDSKAYPNRPHFCFEQALRREGLSFICEVKKASPSKGIISKDFPYMSIATEYEQAGADCISCLTEPKWFLGSDKIFADIRARVNIPMIRKDFTVDKYQIYQAKLMGADAILLICAILDTKTIAAYLEICDQLGLTALVETHDAAEIQSAVTAGARVIGVNNRNLKDFSVDFSNAARLRDLIPPECIYVAESGVSRVEDVAALRQVGADAVLMGEVLMRANNKAALLEQMRNVGADA